jgi:hypothetical protein
METERLLESLASANQSTWRLKLKKDIGIVTATNSLNLTERRIKVAAERRTMYHVRPFIINTQYFKGA